MKPIRNLLLLRGGALGDFLLTLPVLEAFRRQWPRVNIDLVAQPRFFDLVIRAGWVRKGLALDAAAMAQMYISTPDRDPGLLRDFQGYDLAVCYLEDGGRTIERTLATAGIPRRIFVAPRFERGHAIDHFMEGARSAGIPVDGGESARLEFPPEALPRVPRPPGVGPGPYAILHPGSGSRRKNWPLDRYLRLADELRSSGGVTPVFLLGEVEREASGIAQALPTDRPRWEHLDLPAVAAVLKGAHFYVGNDSGITHLSAVLGVPTWALFGPTDPAHWAPRGPAVRILRAAGRGAPEMADLPVSEVWAALRRGALDGLAAEARKP